MKLSNSELLVLNSFLDLVDIYGDAAISEQLVLLAEKSKKVTPRVFQWSQEDLEILRRDYPTSGSYIPELRTKFTSKQIAARANELGIFKNTTKHHGHWRDYQMHILEEKYPIYGTEIPELLTNFSRQQIRARAYRMGLRKFGSWSEEEDAILKSKFESYGTQIPELLATHSAQAIINRAALLGVKYNKHQTRWRESDLAVLREKYPVCGSNIPELVARFGVDNVRNKAVLLHLSKNGRKPLVRFSSEEISILKRDYPKYGTEIPELLAKHDATAIRAKANRLGLHYDASIFKRTQTFNNI